jgi:hypothetical protein
MMTFIELKSRVDSSGMLNLSIPIGAADANREVRVIVEPIGESMTVEQWTEFVQSTAGSIPDPTFERHPQGSYERREKFD